MLETKYQQRNLRKARIYNSKNPYFVTICAYDKLDILTKSKIPEILINSMKWFISNSEIMFLGFVIMPDHLHWTFALKGNYALDNIIRRYKSFVAKEIKELLCSEVKIWQNGYYDHLLRDMKDFKIKLDYMHNNPVRKGLVDNPEEYLYSTANKKYSDMINWEYTRC